MSGRVRILVAGVVASGCAVWCAGAWAVTPGWECVPTTQGLTVTSGGTGATPSCSSGTAVLAPTYVASGVGGKPTVEFSAVNLQVVSGSGTTSGTVNGEGNLVIGYAENANSHPQTGSHNLIVGTNNGWSSYGDVVGGSNDQGLSPFAGVFGLSDLAKGEYSLLTGHQNTTTGPESVAIGGQSNTATGAASAVVGGEFNATNDFGSVSAAGCDNVAGDGVPEDNTCHVDADESTSGGMFDRGAGDQSATLGGHNNTASGTQSATVGGEENTSKADYSAIAGGCGDFAGAGTPPGATCDGGSVGVVGGSHIDAPTNYGSYGKISASFNDAESISLNVSAGGCVRFTLDDSNAQVGDVWSIQYTTQPPAALLIVPEGVKTAGQLAATACNEGSTSVTYSSTVQTFGWH